MFCAPVSVETKETKYVTCPLCKEYKIEVTYTLINLKERHTRDKNIIMCHPCNTEFDTSLNEKNELTLKQRAIPRDVCGYALLKSTNGGTPIYLVIRKEAYRVKNGKVSEEDIAHMVYHINQHTCPTNWTRDIVNIIHNKDDDPHGVFEFVNFISKEDAKRLHVNAGIEFDDDEYRGLAHPNTQLMFPEVFNNGKIIDGDSVEIKGSITSTKLLENK